MQVGCPPNSSKNKDKPVQMQMECGGVGFVYVNQPLSPSQIQVHLLISSFGFKHAPLTKSGLQSFGHRHLQVKMCFNGRIEVWQPVLTTLQILVGHQSVVGWQLVLLYMRTPPTYYYLESSGQATYMETHPYVDMCNPLDFVQSCKRIKVCIGNILPKLHSNGNRSITDLQLRQHALPLRINIHL